MAKTPARPAHRSAWSRRFDGPSRPAAARTRRQVWTLMIIDQQPVRRAAVLAYQQAGERVAELRKTLERHSAVDRPAYTGWLSATFGALLTEFRELTGRIEEKDAMLGAMRLMTMLGGLSPYEAYQQILKGKAAVEEFMAGPDMEDEEGGEEPSEEDLRAEDDMFAGIFEQMFGMPMPDELREGRSEPPPGNSARQDEKPARGRKRRGGNAAEKTPDQRLKTAYRAVVRRLHPDLNPGLGDYDRQLWHEAQSAYERGDTERLETILAVGELARAGELPADSGLAGLLELTRQLEASAGRLEKQLRGLKKDVAWNFTGLASKDKLKSKVERLLSRDVAAARARWTMIEREFATYENAPAPKRKPRAPQKKPSRKPRSKE